MDRRRSIVALVAFWFSFPSARAQSPKGRRIGFLAARSRSTASHPDIYYDAFVAGLKELGYVEGRNLVIEWRFADSMSERLPALASELVKLNVEVIATQGTQPTLAAQHATKSIPIVGISLGDPVASGFATSLARPSGNVTGLTNIINDTSPKFVELLKVLLPTLSRVAVLVNPDNPALPKVLKNFENAAQSYKMTIIPVNARSPGDFELAFANATKANARAIIVMPDPILAGHSLRLAKLAVEHRLPSMTAFPEDGEAGILMSYGQSNVARYRRAAGYVDRILKGAKPQDLPFEQTTLVELAVNGKTAKALGITIPQSILVRADRVIE